MTDSAKAPDPSIPDGESLHEIVRGVVRDEFSAAKLMDPQHLPDLRFWLPSFVQFNRIQHGHSHRNDGDDPIPFPEDDTVDFGATTQQIYLPAFANVTNCDVNRTAWVWDFTNWAGGYITQSNSATAATGDYFSFMALLSPKGSIWQLSFTYFTGPDYGKLKVYMSSLEYEGTRNGFGCPPGKIQPWDAGYGTALNYLSRAGWIQDCYSVSSTQDPVSGQGFFQIIPGGEIGDPLTDLTDAGNACGDASGFDPYTSVSIMDGGPGWYRFKIAVDSKNASSSSYRFRITSATLVRLDDALGA